MIHQDKNVATFLALIAHIIVRILYILHILFFSPSKSTHIFLWIFVYMDG